MRIVLTSVLVDDQEKALHFYRDVLGFKPKEDIPMGHHRWLTLVAPLKILTASNCCSNLTSIQQPNLSRPPS